MELNLSELPSVIRNTTFDPLTNSIIEGANEVVTSVSVSSDILDSGITIIEDLSYIELSGSYEDQFNDSGKYVHRGSSDKLEKPTIFISLNDLPPDEDLFEYIQDPTPQIVITYTVTITYNIITTNPTLSSSQFDLIFVDTFTHTIINDTTTGTTVVGNYYK